MPSPIITLTTDFGVADGFPAAMKGAILAIQPGALIVDVTHEIPAYDVAHASFVLAFVAQAFVPGTVHVAVVDPGVGTDRRALVVTAPDGSKFVCPDNGVIAHVLSACGALQSASHDRPFLEPEPASLPDGFTAFAIENTRYMRPAISRTFHGRDVFAPVAAHLASGTDPRELGPETRRIVVLNLPGPRRSGNRLEGRVQYIDRFGNLATDIDASTVAGGLKSLEIARRRIHRLSRSYETEDVLGCVVASHGFVEVFTTAGNASEELGAAIGDRVIVELQA